MMCIQVLLSDLIQRVETPVWSACTASDTVGKFVQASSEAVTLNRELARNVSHGPCIRVYVLHAYVHMAMKSHVRCFLDY